MKSRSEIDKACAQSLVDLRKRKGLSKAKMAELLNVDVRQWNKYEDGMEAPTVADYFYLFSVLGENPVHIMLECSDPDIYKDVDSNSRVSEIRTASAHYVTEVATNDEIRLWYYLVHGDTGSDYRAQLAEMCMLNHLPMHYKYLIAETIYMYWKLCEAKNTLMNTQTTMPDVDYFVSAMLKGRGATLEDRNSYTMI